ncbi:MAG: NDP-sugar synthase [Thaumarchaeota archaeon]|nr:NDP-sugar synthase [Nitrososphaerota archaeon]
MNLNDLTVIIPVGGEAKRLRPLTAEVSKAVVRIFNRPVVEFALTQLATQGVKNFIFGAKGYINYKSLFDYFREGTGISAEYGISPRVHIKYQPHVEDVGSVDSVRINMDYYNINGPVMVVQGDNLFDLDILDFVRFHEEKNAFMTVALTYVEDVEGYGIADLGKDGIIQRFVEKPKKEEAPSKLANSGIYLMSPKVRELFSHPKIKATVREKGRLDFGMDFIPFLVQEGYPIYGYTLKGEWHDVGTPKSYLQTMLRVLKSKTPLFYFGEPIQKLGRVWIQGQSPDSLRRKEEIVRKVMEGNVKLEGSVLIGRHCQIGDGTTIRDSCIDNFSIIGEDVTIERSSILDRTVIGDGAEIQDSIMGRHVRIKSLQSKPTWVLGVSVIGNDVTIGEGCLVSAAKISPHELIPDKTTITHETIDIRA